MGLTVLVCGRVLLYQINHNAKAPSMITSTVHIMAMAAVVPAGKLLLSATSVGLFGR